jgi:hypothetical protein
LERAVAGVETTRRSPANTNPRKRRRKNTRKIGVHPLDHQFVIRAKERTSRQLLGSLKKSKQVALLT